jgi:predicted MFS family arabinose efflux permease
MTLAISSDGEAAADHGTMGKRHYALFMLVLVYTLNFIDRNILATLLESIKLELGVSDQLLGLLAGFTFALFYATLGIPIASWADRANRRNIIAWAVAVWSGMTALCGVAQNFTQLALARIGVGIGEAGCSPPAHSLIADYYPPEQRATALGIYSLGIPFGIMFGFFVGGWINELYGWRSAFFVVGIPGILLALLFRFTVWEPPRGASEARIAADARPTLMETCRFLSKRRSFIHLAIGAGLAAFVGYGVITFFPAFLIRSHGMESGAVGTWLGLILGIPGGIGIFLGGYCADRFGAHDPRWKLWTVTVTGLVSVPLAVAVYLAETATAALWLFALPIMLSNFYQATTFAQTQSLVGLRMRSVASAILLLIINLIGLGLGPWAVGLLSDLLRPAYGNESLRYALLFISLLGVWSAAHYFRAGQLLPADLQRADEPD